MKVTIIPSDHAQTANGKLYLVGGGWTQIVPGSPFGLGVLIQVPWDQTNRLHKLKLALKHTDGKPVLIPTPIGDKPLEIDANFEVGRPPGIPQGSPLVFALAINFGPLPLPANSRFEWVASVDDQNNPDWNWGFSTSAVSNQPQGNQLGT